MAEKSQRRSVRYDKDQAGCIWGFISFFDFRHGRITRRMLSERSRLARQVVGAGCSMPTQYLTENSYANPPEIPDGEERDSMISVKELMEEDMFVEEDCKELIPNGDIKTIVSGSENKDRIKKKHRRKKKASKSLGGVQLETMNISQKFGPQSSSKRNSEDITSQKADLEVVPKDTSTVDDDSNNEIDLLIEQNNHMVDEKLSEAIRLFVDRRSKDGKIDRSKEFLGALETLSSNKELILELLKDPNSVLVKHIEKLEASHLEEDQNEKLDNSFKKRPNFFRRRSKSEEKIRLSGDDDCRNPNRIVILKPGLPYQSADVLQNEKTGSHFSFTEIKRKLKNAMGKEKYGLPRKMSYDRQNSGNNEKVFGGEKGGWNSPNRNHFYTEKFARPANGTRNKETLFKPRGEKTTMGNEREDGERRMSNIYIEARRHLSNMLSQGDEIVDLSNRPSPQALGKMISIPGYNFSPLNSPRENEQSLVTAKQNLTPLSSFHVAYENTLKLSVEKDIKLCENNLDALEELNHMTVEVETLSFAVSEKNTSDDVAVGPTADAMNKMDTVKNADDLLKEESKVLDFPNQECSSSAINQVGELVEAWDEEESLEQEQLLSSPITSPPSSLIAKHIGDKHTANERLERPSPVSVLEPLFTEDDISPAGIKFQPVESSMQPLRIQFEGQLPSLMNHELYANACLDDEESAFEYVEAVLLASDLNINEFRQRWLSSNSILDPSLFDEVELFSSRSSQDQKLLFDCSNEVLNEVFEGYFGYFPRVSFLKRNVRSIPRGMDLIREIWNGVEWHLLEDSQHTLDRIIRKDFKKEGKWMDLRCDVEGICFEIGDSIFEELVEEIGDSMLSEARIEVE